MITSSAIPGTSHALSRYHSELLKFAEAHPELKTRAYFRREHTLIEETVHSYADSTVKDSQPWPMILDVQQGRRVKRISTEIHRLVTAIPELFFDKDANKVADFYGYDPRVLNSLQRILDLPWRRGGELMRGDFILSQDVLKCIEVNPTAYTGGIFLFNETFSNIVELPLMQEFFREQEVIVRLYPTWDNFLQMVVERAVARSLHRNGTLNLALAIGHPEEYSIAIPSIEPQYQRLLDKNSPGTEGKILFCSYDQMTREKDRLTVNGETIHVVVQLYNDHMVAPVRIEVEAWIDGIIDLYAGPMAWLYHDKRNIALMSEQADAVHFGSEGVFDREEAAFLNRHLPWTRLLAEGRTLYQGEVVDLIPWVMKERQKMVLKPAQSYGGASIYVGPFMSQEEWETRVREALSYESYTVQEYLEPAIQTHQWGESGCLPCSVIWGLFVFGHRFGGGMMRFAPHTDNGILNVANGAETGSLLELLSEEPDDDELALTWSFREQSRSPRM